MKRKLLASDFDGTMCQRYSEDGYPASPEVLEAIRQFRADGGLFGVVTGRDWRWSWYELDTNGKLEFDFVMALNGAQIYDRVGNLLSETTADGNAQIGGRTLLRAMAERCWALGIESFSVIRGRERYWFSAKLPNGGEYDGDKYSPVSMLDSIGSFHMAAAIADKAETITAASGILQAEFGAWVSPMASGRSMDMPPAGINKGIAVAKYAGIAGVPAENIWTAGDNYNDIDMLTPFHGCAMANGVQAACDAAEYVCRDLTEVIAQIRSTEQKAD